MRPRPTRNAIAAGVSVLAALGHATGCAHTPEGRPSSTAGSGVSAGAPSGLSSESLLRILDAEGHWAWMADNPCGPLFEPEIVQYLGDVNHYGGFEPHEDHVDALLAYMRDDSRRTIPRLLVAGYLLELGSQEARRFLEDGIFSHDATTSYSALWVLDSRVLAVPEDEWAVNLAFRCVDELLLRAREAKREQADRMLEEAIERDGGALVMVGEDGIKVPILSGVWGLVSS